MATSQTTRIALIYGTRPELIKMWPIATALKSDPRFEPVIVSSGQHRDMLAPLQNILGIHPDYTLNTFAPGQSLAHLAGKIFAQLGNILPTIGAQAAIVQGDTATTSIGAQAAFYSGMKVIHVEAGLRSGNIRNPFPEEANRRIVTRVADLHLAPTEHSRNNLLREGVSDKHIAVTGNTVIDALRTLSDKAVSFTDPAVGAAVASGRPLALATCHRRENWPYLSRVARAVGELAQRFPGWGFIFPAHANPAVRSVVEPLSETHDNIIVTGFVDYPEFLALEKAARIIISDSGGVQEEAPAFGTPVLCMRETTERPEVVEAGCVKLVGTDPTRIVASFTELATDRDAYKAMARAANPYGTGDAARRSIDAIAKLLLPT